MFSKWKKYVYARNYSGDADHQVVIQYVLYTFLSAATEC